MFTKLFSPSKFMKIAALTAGYTSYSLYQNYTKPSCCGIIGVISNNNNA